MGVKVENTYLSLLKLVRQEKEEEASKNNGKKQTTVPMIIPPIPPDVFEKLRRFHDT
jgi:hypothetical protein